MVLIGAEFRRMALQSMTVVPRACEDSATAQLLQAWECRGNLEAKRPIHAGWC